VDIIGKVDRKMAHLPRELTTVACQTHTHTVPRVKWREVAALDGWVRVRYCETRHTAGEM